MYFPKNVSYSCFTSCISNWRNFSSRTIEVMEPVICYIFCDPVQKQALSYMKVQLLETLISSSKDTSDAVRLALKYLPFMQVN